MSSDEGTMFCTHDHLEQSPHNLQPSPKCVWTMSTNGARCRPLDLAATPAPVCRRSLAQHPSTTRVCGCVLSKWRPNPINPLDAGWLSPLEHSISMVSSGTSGTQPLTTTRSFQNLVIIHPSVCLCTGDPTLSHTLYSSVRVFVPPTSHFVLSFSVFRSHVSLHIVCWVLCPTR